MDCIQCGVQFNSFEEPCPECAWNPNDTLDHLAGYQKAEMIRDRYEIVESLGLGNLGPVLRAVDHVSQQEVAFKVIHPALIPDEAIRARFFTNMRRMIEIEHENMPEVYDVDQDEDDRCFIVRQLAQGVPLQKLMEGRRVNGQLFSIEEVLPIIEQISDVLHSIPGMVHGMLSPNKIWIMPGQFKIIDIGVASSLPPGAVWHRIRSSKRSRSYVAPELEKGIQPDTRSDVFSLGVLIGEMMTQVAFDGRPEVFSESDPDFPYEIDTILRAALHREQDARYVTPDDLLTALYDVTGQGDRALAEDTDVTESDFLGQISDKPSDDIPVVNKTPPASYPGNDHTAQVLMEEVIESHESILQDMEDGDESILEDIENEDESILEDIENGDESILEDIENGDEIEEDIEYELTEESAHDFKSEFQYGFQNESSEPKDEIEEINGKKTPEYIVSSKLPRPSKESGQFQPPHRPTYMGALAKASKDENEEKPPVPRPVPRPSTSLQRPSPPVPRPGSRSSESPPPIPRPSKPSVPIEPKRPSRLVRESKPPSIAPPPSVSKADDQIPEDENHEDSGGKREVTQEIELDMIQEIEAETSSEAASKLEHQADDAERESAKELISRADALDGVDPRFIRAAHKLESDRRGARSRQAAQILRSRAEDLEGIDPRFLRAAARLEEAKVSKLDVGKEEVVVAKKESAEKDGEDESEYELTESDVSDVSDVSDKNDNDDWQKESQDITSDSMISFLAPPVIDSSADVTGFPKNQQRGMETKPASNTPPPLPKSIRTPKN